MRVGSVVLATDQGLGVLAKQFYDNGMFDKVLIKQHHAKTTHLEWYPGVPMFSSYMRHAVRTFLTGLDVVVFFETPFWTEIVADCKRMGIKTVMVPMYEWTPEVVPYTFDRYICPSLLDVEYCKKLPWLQDVIHLTVPVNPATWKIRTRALRFLHNMGNGSVLGRPGTAELLESLQYLKSPIELTIRTQNENFRLSYNEASTPAKVTWEGGTKPYDTLFDEYDVLIAPERFNGLSLPLQEARAAGLFVLTTDRYPTNIWLPKAGMIPVEKFELAQVRPGYNQFAIATVDPKAIAAKIDEIYDTDITEYSLSGYDWASRNSWNALGPIWKNLIVN